MMSRAIRHALGPAAGSDASWCGLNVEDESNVTARQGPIAGGTILRGYTDLCVSAVFAIR